MNSSRKYNYRLLSPNEANHLLSRAFENQAKLTLWEAGNVNRKVCVPYKFKKNPDSFILVLEIDETTLPPEWKNASLLFHMLYDGFSYLGKVLSENKNSIQQITFDAEAYVLEKRKFFRLGVWGKHPITLRIKFVNPPLIIRKHSQSNVISLFAEGDVTNMWANFLDLVKRVTTKDEGIHEVSVSFPIIDLSVSGVAIAVTEAEVEFFKSLGSIENAATLLFPNESVDLPKLDYVHSTPWVNETSSGRVKAGFDFSGDTWVRKQLEVKLKSYSSNVEDGFDQFLQ